MPRKKPLSDVPRNQPSSIDELPRAVREELDILRTQERVEISELLAWLKGKGYEVSRSALGRHVRQLHIDVHRAGQMLARSQSISKALMERFGDSPDNELARANIQLMHGQVFDMLIREAEADAEAEVASLEPASDALIENDTGKRALHDPLTMVRLSKTIQQLLSAEKMNVERVAAIRKDAIAEERERAAAAVDNVVAARGIGLSQESVDAIRRAVLGSDG